MIIFLRFVFSWPGMLTVAALYVVTRYPQGSAEVVAATFQGIGAFFTALTDLLGIDTKVQPSQ